MEMGIEFLPRLFLQGNAFAYDYWWLPLSTVYRTSSGEAVGVCREHLTRYLGLVVLLPERTAESLQDGL
jgi:hypothetical protein